MTDDRPADVPNAQAGDPQHRLHSDVAREIDLRALEYRLMQALGSQGQVIGGRIDALNDELTGYIVQHSQDHTSFATNWEQRWSAITADLAYRKGLIGFPRLVLEWLRQYLPTVATLLFAAAAVIGFLTGNFTVGVGQ